MKQKLSFLVAESEPPSARESRRESVGQSSGERYVTTLQHLAPDAQTHLVRPAEHQTRITPAELATYDAVFLAGSPLHFYQDTPEAREQVGFMRAVFASGTPSFGSCAGLQLAAAAAGGTIRPNRQGQVAGIVQNIWLTEAGRNHPLLHGRPPAYSAASIHSDEVASLPPGATLLAGSAATPVEAAEIRYGNGVFWGVQYHPELPLSDIAAALRRQSGALIEHGLARTPQDIDTYAAELQRLEHDPARKDIAWRLGLGPELIDPARRQRELRNFIDYLVKPTQTARHRAHMPAQ